MSEGTSGAGLPARLTALVARAAAEAGRTGQAVLVSVTEEVGALHPLAALDAAAGACHEHAMVRTLVHSGRMYWSHRASRFEFAAIGAAAVVAPAGADRFARADAAWQALLATALIDAPPADARAAIGPLLVGGFAFDAQVPSSGMWRGFPAAHLIVPALCVSVRDARHHVTASLLVDAQGAGEALATLLQLHHAVRSAGGHRVTAATLNDSDASPAPTFEPLRPVAAWRALVRAALARIDAGDFRKVVLARAERTAEPIAPDVLAILAHLKESFAQAYVFGCWRGERTFLGATPERLVRVTGRVVEASSLAGSAPRGITPAGDAAAALHLGRSEKDLAEHALVLESLRQALNEVADQVVASDTPSVLTLPNVHHLHTAIRARLRDGHSVLGVAGALHPTPAVGGAPRDSALQFIRANELLDRGWYAAPIGWIGREDGELAVALRSALVSADDATLFAGCGIVRGSDPDAELAESEVKLRVMEGALSARRAEAGVAPDPALAAPAGASCR